MFNKETRINNKLLEDVKSILKSEWEETLEEFQEEAQANVKIECPYETTKTKKNTI